MKYCSSITSGKIRKILWGFLLTMLFCPGNALFGEKAEYMTSYGINPIVFWKKFYGACEPYPEIIRRLAKAGTTDLVFYDQNGRGGSFVHPTEVENTKNLKIFLKKNGLPKLASRDLVKEFIEECAKFNIKVWLAFTPPMRGHKPKGFDENSVIHYGLNNPDLIKLYLDEIDEIAQKYGKYKNLAGIWWEELNCAEIAEPHDSDLADFNKYCEKNFGETYSGTWPISKADSENKWWRRFYLYKNNIVNSFVQKMSMRAKKYGLKTELCFYYPEIYPVNDDSWKWGYDIVGLEKFCDRIWIAGFGSNSEINKFYQSIKGVWIDYGLSYAGQMPSKGLASSFHGKAISCFDSRSSLFPNETREHHKRCGLSWPYGDYYTGYLKLGEKEFSLFYGDELIKWNKLIKDWQPGKSPSNIAIAINPVPFIMKNPICGEEFKSKVIGLEKALEEHMNIDGFVIGTESFFEKGFLEKYSLIILPEDMSCGLSEKSYTRLLSYVKNGGTVLIIDSPPTVSKADLTKPKNMDKEFCGIEIKDKSKIPLQMESSFKGILPADLKEKIEITQLEPHNASVLIKEKNSTQPLLTENKLGSGKVYFSTVSFSPELSKYFSSLIDEIGQPSISLKSCKSSLLANQTTKDKMQNNDNKLRILESVIKDGVVCVSLFGKGETRLSINTEKIGIEDNNFQIKDIVTGKIIKDDLKKDDLKNGMLIKVNHARQPAIIAAGPKNKLTAFSGLYENDAVFKGMDVRKMSIENPEVPIIIPPGKGARIGVYYGSDCSNALVKTLKEAGFRAFILPRLGQEAASCADLIIISVAKNTEVFDQAKDEIRNFVKNGGSVMLFHRATGCEGYRKHEAFFPEIGKGFIPVKDDKLEISQTHNALKSFKKGDSFEHSYADHITMSKGKLGETLIADKKSLPTLVVGKFGKGKVCLNGMLTGFASEKKGSYAGRPKEPTGKELDVLLDTIRWLTEKNNDQGAKQ